MSDMADVLAELDAHRPTHSEYTGGWWELACTGCDFAKGRRLSHLDWTPHHAHRAEIFAAALSAAGFGPVQEARPLRRRGQPRRVLPPAEDQEPYKYPPDPYWGKDTRGRWQYVDYDGESLVVRFESDGDMWLDKEGQGPVYVRKEHIPVIIAALNGDT